MPILEGHGVLLTTDDCDRMVTFCRDGLGVEPGDVWTDHGRGQLLNGGKGAVELLASQHRVFVDEIEVGYAVSAQIRFVFHVSDVHLAVKNALKYGAKLVHEPSITPWNDLNAWMS